MVAFILVAVLAQAMLLLVLIMNLRSVAPRGGLPTPFLDLNQEAGIIKLKILNLM